MKVVYRSIGKEIEQAIETAMATGRTIQYVELTPSEFSELSRENQHMGFGICDGYVNKFLDVEIRRTPRAPFKVGV